MKEEVVKPSVATLTLEEIERNSHVLPPCGYFVSVECHSRNCRLCKRFPELSCFREHTQPFPASFRLNTSGYVKFSGTSEHLNAFIMNKVYDDTREDPLVVGKLYHDGDWREYITTTMDSKGFHYLYVALNNYEKYTNRNKSKTQAGEPAREARSASCVGVLTHCVFASLSLEFTLHLNSILI